MRNILLQLAKDINIYMLYRYTMQYLSNLKYFYWIVPILKIKRKKKIINYFQNNNTYKLAIGSGDKILEGWLNTDLEPSKLDTIYLNACENLPFEDESLDFINCEQFIEHIKLKDAKFFLNECFRVLKKNGVLRISTPCLDNYIELFYSLNSSQLSFIENFKKFHNIDFISPEIILNYMFYNWGHQHLYTKKGIYDLMLSSKFTKIKEEKLHISSHIELQNIEMHQLFYGEELNQFSTMVWEFSK